MEILDFKNREETELALRHTIRRFYFALICQTIGSILFKSLVLSFCTMFSRKIQGSGVGQGPLIKPGNYNSHLSALT